MTAGFPSIWSEIVDGNDKIIVGGVYREWRDNNKDGSREAQRFRLNIFLGQIERALSEKKRTLVVGDFNLDFSRIGNENYAENYLAKELRNFVESSGLDIIDIGPTFSMNIGSSENPKFISTCIDHVYAGNGIDLLRAGTISNGMSDHDPVIVKMRKKSSSRKPTRKNLQA